MTKYHYNRDSTGRAACNKNLRLAAGKRTNRCMSAKAIRRNGWHEMICRHCAKIVSKESGGTAWNG